MTAGIARLFTDVVQVSTPRNGKHPGFTDPVTVLCYLNDARKLVATGTAQETVSPVTIYAPISAAVFAPDAKVTLPDGRPAKVLTVERHEHGPLSAHHFKITLI